MFRTLTNCAIVTLALILVVASTASASSHIQTLHQEDFESYADGSQLNDAANWASDGPILVTSKGAADSVGGHDLDSGLALDGNSHNPVGSGGGRKWATSTLTFPGPAADAAKYTVSFEARTHYGSNSNGTGNAGVFLNTTGNQLSEFGLLYYRSNGKGWHFVTSGDETTGPSTSYPFGGNPWHFASTSVKGTIIFDKTTMKASASIEDIGSGGYGTHNFTDVVSFTDEVWNNITGLHVRNDVYDTGDNRGIDVDNIIVTQTLRIPEPATLSLLGLGGLAMLRRRRA